MKVVVLKHTPGVFTAQNNTDLGNNTIYGGLEIEVFYIQRYINEKILTYSVTIFR